MAGQHPDLMRLELAQIDDETGELEAVDTIAIDRVRALIDFVQLTSHRQRAKVAVIAPAERMNAAAANALLKTLEEPPPATLIVLVSDRPAQVIATIRSRCRDVALAAPEREVALQWLRGEGVEECEAALAHAGGSPLFARELAVPEEAALRRRVMAELARPGGADAPAFSAGIDREALERTVYWMQTWVQDLVRVRAGCAQRYHVDLEPVAKAKARGADLDRLLDLDRELLAARALVAHPLNARLVAEHLLMTYNQATSGSRPGS
jgi:DNA polymerase-3 subunit delta'